MNIELLYNFILYISTIMLFCGIAILDIALYMLKVKRFEEILKEQQEEMVMDKKKKLKKYFENTTSMTRRYSYFYTRRKDKFFRKQYKLILEYYLINKIQRNNKKIKNLNLKTEEYNSKLEERLKIY